MKDYATYSYWLGSCGDDLTPRAVLDGSDEVIAFINGLPGNSLFQTLLRKLGLRRG